MPYKDPEKKKEWARLTRLRLAAAGYPPKKRKRCPRKMIWVKDPILLHQIRLMVVKHVLDSVGGHRRKASEMLGISYHQLYRILKDDGI